MDKNLVLVESPAKAKTINKYLGRKFMVEATVGHIKNLPKTTLGVDVENGFKPKLVTIRGKGDVVKKIKSLAKKSKKIFIATDPDREGEAIAEDIAEVLNGKAANEVYRVLFNEITKQGVKKGMDTPRKIDNHLVESQRARRILDRIIGYKVSPLLWRAMIEESDNSLSAGRVQSVALRLICEREDEIKKFIPTEFWTIQGIFGKKKNESFKAKLHSYEDRELKTPPKPEMTEEDWKEFNKKYFAIPNEKTAKEVVEKLDSKDRYYISDITKKTSRRNPSPPFITSTLQAEASKVLRLRPRNTMRLAQQLYEGIELGKEGTVGLITYMRTDSTRLSDEIVKDARTHIDQNFGKDYLPDSPNVYTKKKQKVQDAHEAIRPTSIEYTPEFVKPYLNDKQFKLYQLIWMRFVASQMMPAKVETTTIDIKADEFIFKSVGTAIVFKGFMQVYFEQEEDDDNGKDDSKDNILPVGLEKENDLNLYELIDKQSFTKPAPRYTESSLIKELESNGIGRPSTYSMIVSTIMDRNYVDQVDRKLQPTELGYKVKKVLVDNFPKIFNVNFTAQMEDELDQIAAGEVDYQKVLKDFYDPFIENLEDVEEKVEKIECEKCGSEMIIKVGRFGKFLACSNYPDCKNIKSLKEFSKDDGEPEYTGEKCEKCGARTVYRHGRFGKFIGCERYPDCDFIKNITLGISCPKCKDGEIVERFTRRKRKFYGCSKYPDCDFAAWNKPVDKECPECGNAYMEEKYTQKKGSHLKCPECGHEVENDSTEQDS